MKTLLVLGWNQRKKMNDITFAKALSSVILDNKYDRFVKNRRTGKLDTRGLYKIDISSRLFKRREARKNKHYAISLVVDCSGSMAGSKIEMAAESARKLSYHLHKMDIPHNIVTFELFAREIKPMNTSYDEKVEQKILGTLGYGPLVEHYYMYGVWLRETFVLSQKNRSKLMKYVGCFTNKQLSKEIDQLNKLGVRFNTASGPGMNSDAEAVKFVRERLLKTVGRKIMVHLSDGQPAPMMSDYESPINPGYAQTDFNLKREVDLTLASGIELYSIGICSDAVNRFYPPRRTASINDIKQLYPHIIKLIRLNLRRG